MLRASSPAAGLSADLADLTGPLPEPSLVERLYELAGAYTGLGPESPLTAEIVEVAAAMAAMLIERPSSGANLQRLASRRDLPVRSRSWPGPGPDGPARLTGRNDHPDAARLSLAGMPTLPTDGQMCAVLAVDIVGFTRPDRDDEIRRYLHEKLYEYLQAGFDDSGIPWQDCFNEDRGDGALIVVPPGISFKGLIHPLPDMLRDLIRRHNHVSRESAEIQLRIAAHIGPVDYDGHGFVGTDVNLAFRILEARPVKRMLADSGAELCLAVSDYVYQSFVCHYPSLLRPDTFRAVRFQVKNTRARAWAYLPGTSS